MKIADIYTQIEQIVESNLTGYVCRSIIKPTFNEILQKPDKIVLAVPINSIPVGYRNSCKLNMFQTFWVGLKQPLKASENEQGEWSAVGARDTICTAATTLLQKLSETDNIRVVSKMDNSEPLLTFYDVPQGADQYLWGKFEVNIEYYEKQDT